MKVFVRNGLVVGLICLAYMAPAQEVPQQIVHQGRLTNSDGTPMSGQVSLELNIYDAEEGGTLVWGPQQLPQVALVDGYFQVLIGPEDVASRSLVDAFGDGSRYLGIKIGTSPETEPRQQILSAPFALKANEAIHAESADVLSPIPPNTRMAVSEILSLTARENDAYEVIASITLSTTGRPVLIGLIPGPGPGSFISIADTLDGRNTGIDFRFLRRDLSDPDSPEELVYDGTIAINRFAQFASTSTFSPTQIQHFDVDVAAGEYEYSLQIRRKYSSAYHLRNVRLMGMEL